MTEKKKPTPPTPMDSFQAWVASELGDTVDENLDRQEIVKHIQQTLMDGFQEKITKKLSDALKEALPDEVLGDYIQRAVDETFFQTRKSSGGANGKDLVEHPSWFAEEVRKIAEPIIHKRVNAFVDQRSELIENGINEYLNSNHLAIALSQRLNQNLETIFEKFTNNFHLR